MDYISLKKYNALESIPVLEDAESVIFLTVLSRSRGLEAVGMPH